MAVGIQTYRQTGNYNFTRYRGDTGGKYRDKSKESGKEVLRQWLIRERGFLVMNTWTVGTSLYLFLPIYAEHNLTIERATFYKYIKDLM